MITPNGTNKEWASGFRIEDVDMRFGAYEVFSGLSCTIMPGCGWGILGNSGSGKSTLLRLMAGLEAPCSGNIYLHGQRVSGPMTIFVAPRERRISMVFQDLALWPNLTVMENVLLCLIDTEDAHQQAERSLSICGIDRLSSKYPGQLSGGEQQRLALARALASKPEFLFLDEPFNGLDITIKNSIIKEIKGLAEKNRITVVLISHDPYEVLSLCRKVIVIEQGRVAESGNIYTLLERPASSQLAAFREYMERIGKSDTRIKEEA